jgi:acetyltransferase-like isoleucine patch superfamily enzyme
MTIRQPTIRYLGENDKGSDWSDYSTGHFVLIRENCVIGDNVNIGSFTEISHSVIIEDNVRIHSHCFISEYTYISEGAWLGPRVTICNDRYPNRCDRNEKKIERVLIGKNVVIGANVTILPGVVIGSNSIIGAGTVLTKAVPSNTTIYEKRKYICK